MLAPGAETAAENPASQDPRRRVHRTLDLAETASDRLHQSPDEVFVAIGAPDQAVTLFAIAPDFYPVDAAVAARPRIRRLFRRLTLLWGLVIVIKGSLTLWLLLSLSTVDFVPIKTRRSSL